ncbi:MULTISPECIES: hypothetical protein [Bacillus]|uniref:hypothetical protein n=1 Tax=Bacillus TaxID=1386 RepID=UPI002118396F|nr:MULTISPECIES: hypothetical protein [Bacillus]WFA05142.1 hypothetical protein P3X63_21690 [Bacillus sp. HSf4]
MSSEIMQLSTIQTTDTSDYLDFNEENRNNDNGKDYSNAYTDMDSEAMTEDINHLKSANPEVYEKLQKMDITAAAGAGPYTKYSDDIVSVESQNGEILDDLIDNKPQFEIEESGLKHLYEAEDSDFVDLIQDVNKKEAE